MQHCFNDSPLTILLHRPRSPRDDAIARPQLWQGFQQWHWLFEVHLAVSFDGGRRWRCRWLGSHVLLDSISDHLYAWVRVEGVGSEICKCRVLWFGVRCQGLRVKNLYVCETPKSWGRSSLNFSMTNWPYSQLEYHAWIPLPEVTKSSTHDIMHHAACYLILARSACVSTRFLSCQNLPHTCYKLKPDLTKNGKHILSVFQILSEWQKLGTLTKNALHPTSTTHFNVCFEAAYYLILVGSPNARLAILSCLTHHTVVVIRCDVSLVALPCALLCI